MLGTKSHTECCAAADYPISTCGKWSEAWGIFPGTTFGSTPPHYQNLWDKDRGCDRKWCHYAKAKHGIALGGTVQGVSWGTAPTSNPQFMSAFTWVRHDVNMSCSGILGGDC